MALQRPSAARGCGLGGRSPLAHCCLGPSGGHPPGLRAWRQGKGSGARSGQQPAQGSAARAPPPFSGRHEGAGPGLGPQGEGQAPRGQALVRAARLGGELPAGSASRPAWGLAQRAAPRARPPRPAAARPAPASGSALAALPAARERRRRSSRGRWRGGASEGSAAGRGQGGDAWRLPQRPSRARATSSGGRAPRPRWRPGSRPPPRGALSQPCWRRARAAATSQLQGEQRLPARRSQRGLGCRARPGRPAPAAPRRRSPWLQRRAGPLAASRPSCLDWQRPFHGNSRAQQRSRRHSRQFLCAFCGA